MKRILSVSRPVGWITGEVSGITDSMTISRDPIEDILVRHEGFGDVIVGVETAI